MSKTTSVAERPILFSGEMVRAILAGKKTETRRVVKSPHPTWTAIDGIPGYENEMGEWVDIRCPFGVPGDRLWVRETWCEYVDGSTDDKTGTVCYKADGAALWMCKPRAAERRTHGMRADFNPVEEDCIPRWRPSIHMPRWASRLTLEVTGVRVERLKTITLMDIDAEGFGVGERQNHTSPYTHLKFARGAFLDKWNALNAKRGYPWESNPWVWVVEFRRVG